MYISAELMNKLSTGVSVKMLDDIVVRLKGGDLQIILKDGQVKTKKIVECLRNKHSLSYQAKMHLVENCDRETVASFFGLSTTASKQELYFACCVA